MIYHYLPQRKASDIKEKTIGSWRAISKSKGSLQPPTCQYPWRARKPCSTGRNNMSTEQG